MILAFHDNPLEPKNHEMWGPPVYVYILLIIASFRIGVPSIFLHTLESGINIPLGLLIFWLFSRGYGLIPDFIEPIYVTRVFGAYGPIMFALWVLVGFGASWLPYVRTAVFFQFQLNSSFMFGRTHGIMFGRTLFEYCVRKDTLNCVRKDTFQNMINKTF